MTSSHQRCARESDRHVIGPSMMHRAEHGNCQSYALFALFILIAGRQTKQTDGQTDTQQLTSRSQHTFGDGEQVLCDEAPIPWPFRPTTITCVQVLSASASTVFLQRQRYPYCSIVQRCCGSRRVLWDICKNQRSDGHAAIGYRIPIH